MHLFPVRQVDIAWQPAFHGDQAHLLWPYLSLRIAKYHPKTLFHNCTQRPPLLGCGFLGLYEKFVRQIQRGFHGPILPYPQIWEYG